MTYQANVYNVLIASPGDVTKERKIISETIYEWNALHSKEEGVVLLPLKWETHSAPKLGDRPQEIINKDIVDISDLTVVVFWQRLGSSTGVAESGTIEEIERMLDKGKLVMVYFSKAKINPDKIDYEQHLKLRKFKEELTPKGLYSSFKNQAELKNLLFRDLTIRMRELQKKKFLKI